MKTTVDNAMTTLPRPRFHADVALGRLAIAGAYLVALWGAGRALGLL